MAAPFGHLLTAMITPFGPDGAVDHGRVWDLAHHLVETGSDGIVVAGTTGESPTLSDEEKVALFGGPWSRRWGAGPGWWPAPAPTTPPTRSR